MEPPSSAAPSFDSRGLPGGPPGARLERLRAVLTQVDAQAADAHLPVLLASLAVGAAAIPAGAVMWSRDGEDDEATSIGGAILVGTGIGSVLGGVVQMFLPLGATMGLGEELESAAASGASADVVVLAVEQQWAETAADARLARKFGGAVGMGIGAIAVGAGTTIALVEPEGLSATDQAVLASGLVVAGSLSLVGGIQIFFTETPQEVAWSTYAASNGIAKEPLVVAPRLSLAPSPGGGGVTFDARF